MVENFDVLNCLKQSFSNENTILKSKYLLSRQEKQYIRVNGSDMVGTVFFSTPLLYSRTYIPTALELETFKEISVFQYVSCPSFKWS